MEKAIKISGMHCSSCEKMVAMALEDVEGVKLLSISSNKGEAKLQVENDAALALAKKAIEAEGYKIK